MGREWRMRVNASERIKNMRSIIAATKRLGVKPPRAMVRYLTILERIKSWNRKETLHSASLAPSSTSKEGGEENGKE